MNRRQLIVIATLAVVSSTAGFLWAASNRHEHTPQLRYSQERGLHWTCSMHPQVRLDAPGSCPICGMALVPGRQSHSGESGDVKAGSPITVRISPQTMQNLGVRTAPATLGSLSRRIEAAGRIEIDEGRIAVVGARATGWLERLHVRTTGEPVRKGQLLAEIYSPDLFKAQEEFVVALESGNEELAAATRERLVFLDVGAAQIAQIERTLAPQRRVRILAPADGHVLELAVREGAQIMPDMPLFKLGDLSRVWVIGLLPESQSEWIAAGVAVQVRVPALADGILHGSLDYVYPQLDATTRALRVRATLDNSGRKLRPGMYADMTIISDAAQQSLLVPSEAVIRTGKRNVVLVAAGQGRFRPAEVRIGLESGGQTAIISGLEAGQHVVTSGQFLIDSEASLSGAYARFTQEDAR